MIFAPTPSPSPAPQVEPTLGSPGFIGFLFTFLLAAALIVLALSMTRQLRKVNRNERLRAAAEEAAAEQPGADDSDASAQVAAPATTSADAAHEVSGASAHVAAPATTSADAGDEDAAAGGADVEAASADDEDEGRA